MKVKVILLLMLGFGSAIFVTIGSQNNSYHPEFTPHGSFEINTAYAYPPGVGIFSNSKNCLSCYFIRAKMKIELKLFSILSSAPDYFYIRHITEYSPIISSFKSFHIKQ